MRQCDIRLVMSGNTERRVGVNWYLYRWPTTYHHYGEGHVYGSAMPETPSRNAMLGKGSLTSGGLLRFASRGVMIALFSARSTTLHRQPGNAKNAD